MVFMTRAWLALMVAIVFELVASYYVKLCEGLNWERRLIVFLAFFFYNLSIVMDIIAMEDIDVSTGYGIWAGTGMVGSSVIGVLFYNEILSPLKIFASTLVMIGVILMHIADDRIQAGIDKNVSWLFPDAEQIIDGSELAPLTITAA